MSSQFKPVITLSPSASLRTARALEAVVLRGPAGADGDSSGGLSGAPLSTHPCALCGAVDDLVAYTPFGAPPEAGTLLACGRCHGQLAPGAALDPGHWRCLQESAWSTEPAVQGLAFRLLGRLGEPWAADLRDQLWLEPEVRAWAEAPEEAPATQDAMRVVDCNGALLQDGDAVTLIKDLDVKGGGFVAKRGTLVKGIRLGDDPTHVEGKVNGTAIYLKTAFLKKA